MERKIGETFQFQGHNLRVVEGGRYQCKECFFYNRDCSSMMLYVTGFCSKEHRTDKKCVIFIEHNDKQPQELNLCEILKNCPKGFRLYTPASGDIQFVRIVREKEVPLIETEFLGEPIFFSKEGVLKWGHFSGECLLFPSKYQRDWSKFTAPWYKKERFDPNTLKAFDRVIVRLDNMCQWRCDLFSNAYYNRAINCLCTSGNCYKQCIPYNDDTKHLLGTTDEAPEFYRYWDEELDETERGEGGYDHTNVK